MAVVLLVSRVNCCEWGEKNDSDMARIPQDTV